MGPLKPLHKQAVPTAIEKAKHYRLLNDPENAESICRDILEIEPEHQDALRNLILAITDQFRGGSPRVKETKELIARLNSDYDQSYYRGLILERAAKSFLAQNTPASPYAAYDRFREAMEHFEKAESLSDDTNDDAILRWNSCARIIAARNLKANAEDNYVPYGD